MSRLLFLVTLLVMGPLSCSAFAQQIQPVVDRFAGTPTPGAVAPQALAIPDSVRQQVGYQHWRGAAIGAGLGAVAGLALGVLARQHCADCNIDDTNLAKGSLVVAGVGGGLGFLAGLASPKYRWVPSTR